MAKDSVLEKLEELNRKIDSLQSRKQRERQYSLILLSSITAVLLALIVQSIFNLVPESLKLAITLITVEAAIVFIFVFVLPNLQKVLELGDIRISFKIKKDSTENRKNLLRILIEAVRKENVKFSVSPQLMGIQTFFIYYLKRIGEPVENKIKYLKKNINEVKNLYLEMRGKGISGISVNFMERECVVSLDTKDYTPELASKIESKLKSKLNKLKIAENWEKSGF